MRIAGIIAEYDPFHAGHAAHIAATRHPEGGNATHMVAVLSGSFTQRGEPALMTKFHRAEMALRCGVDLVVELPLPWAMAPAERFATGGVALLEALGCVDVLSFGSECGNIHDLQKLAALQETPAFGEALRRYMDTGIPYAAARQAAAAEHLGEEVAAHLATPNNTLGVAYMQAANELKSNLSFYTLKRKGSGHNDAAPKDGYATAGQLRKWIRAHQVNEVQKYMPQAAVDVLKRALDKHETPANETALETALLARLRTMSEQELGNLPYLSEGLENRLYRAVRSSANAQELWDSISTRRYPQARLRRILWAALLGFTKDNLAQTPPYIRVLGMNKKGEEILAAANPTLPLFTKSSQLKPLSPACQALFALEQRATDLHALALPTPPPCGADCTKKLLRL